MRKVTRTILTAIGVRTDPRSAPMAMAGLELARATFRSHIVDWEMPMIDGAQFVRMIRTPGSFRPPKFPSSY